MLHFLDNLKRPKNELKSMIQITTNLVEMSQTDFAMLKMEKSEMRTKCQAGQEIRPK